MKVKVLRSFVGDRPYNEGEVCELKTPRDWVECGLVEVIETKMVKPKKKKSEK